MPRRLQHVPGLPQAIPRDTQGMPTGHGAAGNCGWTVNVYVGHILSSQLLTDRPSRTRGITLHQPF
jgi:hypothetical protein